MNMKYIAAFLIVNVLLSLNSPVTGQVYRGLGTLLGLGAGLAVGRSLGRGLFGYPGYGYGYGYGGYGGYGYRPFGLLGGFY